MTTKENFYQLMDRQTELALATSVDNEPNVRIVNFYFNPQNNRIYFATFRGNDKVRELRANSHVAFTTIPHSGNAHVKGRGIAQKSSQTIFDLADCFIQKIPDYRTTVEQAGKALLLYEIEFTTAIVTLDLDNQKKIKLG